MEVTRIGNGIQTYELNIMMLWLAWLAGLPGLVSWASLAGTANSAHEKIRLTIWFVNVIMRLLLDLHVIVKAS